MTPFKMDPNKKGNFSSVRRIYKGDVPSICDSDKDLENNVICQQHRCFHFRSSSRDTDDYPTPVVPVPVRRHSLKTSRKDQQPLLEKFPDNAIITSRYTMWNFIPKNLFEQFRRLVNFYFLVGALIHSIVDSPVHPFTAVSPLTFVILVTAIKQGYEDWLRHKNDDQVNNRAIKLVKKGNVLETKSKDLRVGDVLKLEADEQVPTDILLLGCSDEYLRCQINTANLDGETNLKLRYCPSGLPHFKTPEDFNNLHVILECEHPCEDLYEFSGSILIPEDKLSEMHWSPSDSLATISEPGRDSDSLKNDRIESLKSGGLVRQGVTDFISIPVSMENMVLRGTRLKNTEFIYGLVVYTGRDTRLARNSEKTQAKFSTVESTVNIYVIFFIGLLIILVIFCSVMYFHVEWWYDEIGDPWYLQSPSAGSSDVFQTVASFVILFNYIIPISLYVTIELQKFLGSKFFVWDNDMVDDEGKEPLCNTSDLNEELGQIEYLFSDKTGTLTQNLMQFRHCSIDAVRYEYRPDDLLYVSTNKRLLQSKENIVFGSVNVAESPEILQFFRILALCHSVQVVAKRKSVFGLDPTSSSVVQVKVEIGKHDGGTRQIQVDNPFVSTSVDHFEYQASSPDEKALVESSRKLGVVYVGIREDMMTLNVAGIVEKYRRLMHLEFDADRKCMSVIVENNKGEIWLFTKGAESSITPKCDDGPIQETLKHVMDFAVKGLRTLAVAQRKLTQKEYEEFNLALRVARRSFKSRQEKVREVYNSVEEHLTLMGATGVEDQLQENVPETLISFAEAGIHVWMLTGDKLETGVNVAVACGLITASTKQFVLSKTTDPDDIRGHLKRFLKEIRPLENTCFVIDGESLAVAIRECSDLLRDVSMTALRVVCCRMAPLQKAQVVQMVKSSPKKPTCCAVGDGANDCAMIMSAHVGIGILGKEGRQAARCADFALGQFGFLRKAILVHGHWYYVRLANLANYFFYKNVVFVLPQLFFSFQSSFSTQAIFNGLFLMNYNIFFTSCPIFYYGLTEQLYSAETLLKHPHLYKRNKKNSLMTVKNFLPWFLSGIWHAVVCYYLTYFSWGNFPDMNDLATFGTVVFTGVLVTSNNKMAVETNYLSFWYLGSHIYSYATFTLLTAVYSEVNFEALGLDPGDFRHVFFTMLSSVNFWLLMGLVTVVSILPDILFAAIKQQWVFKSKK